MKQKSHFVPYRIKYFDHAIQSIQNRLKKAQKSTWSQLVNRE